MHKDKKKRQQNGTDKRNDQINVKINESAKNVEEKSEHPEKPKSEESPKPEDKLTTTEKKVETTTNPPVLPVIQPKRNYASKECGAKVIHANEEAEHVKAVLNDRERDEYARNPCEKAKNKFIIIELCETIQ
uniref:Uncharacterized protein n=2 Tax=Bursaphelenchus xylophilus TaxID=6326 RepID=A0A1I7SHZ2_BURXY